MAKPGWDRVWAVGVVRARGGVGTHWQPLNTLKTPRNASQVWVVARKRGGGMWAVWAVRARGGVGTHWQPLNTLKTPRKCKPGAGSGEAGVGWGVGGVGGEGVGGCGHALAAFKYSLNT